METSCLIIVQFCTMNKPSFRDFTGFNLSLLSKINKNAGRPFYSVPLPSLGSGNFLSAHAIFEQLHGENER